MGGLIVGSVHPRISFRTTIFASPSMSAFLHGPIDAHGDQFRSVRLAIAVRTLLRASAWADIIDGASFRPFPDSWLALPSITNSCCFAWDQVFFSAIPDPRFVQRSLFLASRGVWTLAGVDTACVQGE